MNWKRFSQLKYDVTVDSVITALDLEIPPEGRPDTFVSGFSMKHIPIDNLIVKADCASTPGREFSGVFVLFHEGSSRMTNDAGVLEAARKAKINKGTATGDALRRWIQMWSATTIAA